MDHLLRFSYIVVTYPEKMSDEDGPPKKRVRWESTADGTANETIERYSEELTEIEDTEEERGEKVVSLHSLMLF